MQEAFLTKKVSLEEFKAMYPKEDDMQDRIKELAVKAGGMFDPDFYDIKGGDRTMWLLQPHELERFAKAVARECLQDDDALIEAMAEHTYGATRADAIEWAKEDKFDSHCQQARKLLEAMRPVIRARFGLATPPGDG